MRGLVGECDFILALTDPFPLLRAPLVVLVEAKKADIELGLGQCVAEMAGAKAFNDAAGEPDRPVYGCVSNGEVWQFLRLVGTKALQDTRRYALNELGLILAVFNAITAEAVAVSPPAP